jgi:exoribonuclease-2
MHVLFEEDGAFKAGTVLADNVTSLQVELPSGKRAKVKATNVLMRFVEPSAADLLERAGEEAEGFDIDFLWEACGDDEFSFDTLAEEYFGHAAKPVEAASILLRLHSAPIYFHRKGKGRFRKAPAEILRAALGGLEKKRQQALAIERMAEELKSHALPAEFRPRLAQLLYKPDRNSIETKALESACAQTGLSSARLLAMCGAIPSHHDYHLDRFVFEHFPRGIAFGPFQAAESPTGLPCAEVEAFSIDDATTTEIDDAFSVTPRSGGGWRIGIHIAAPGLGFAPNSDLDSIARERLSTVYMPGRKITMLPESVLERFTLSAGGERPAVTLYLDVAPDFRIEGSESRVEGVPVRANLRHHEIEPLFNDDTLAMAEPRFPFKAELTLLWEFAQALEAGRGKASAAPGLKEYNFYVDWTEPEGRVTISERRRGSPLDKLVAELMIIANSTWGKLLEDAGVAGIYRSQSAGKVRMSTAALPHDGLGVDQYAWCTSPLRRYVDLINQWQLLACLQGATPPFAVSSESLLAAMRDFELAYAAYNEFQRSMERYWCLRWLLQEGCEAVTGQVMREGLVKIDAIPLYVRVPSLPPCESGTRVRLGLESVDLLELEARWRYSEMLSEVPPNRLETDRVTG